jgi:hypothetical protein
MPAKKEKGFSMVRLKIRENAAQALEEMTLSPKRKGELISDLLLAAQERLATVRSGKAPMDEFTRVLLQVEYERKQKESQA